MNFDFFNLTVYKNKHANQYMHYESMNLYLEDSIDCKPINNYRQFINNMAIKSPKG